MSTGIVPGAINLVPPLSGEEILPLVNAGARAAQTTTGDVAALVFSLPGPFVVVSGTAPLVISGNASAPASFPISTIIEIVGASATNAGVTVDTFGGAATYIARRSGGTPAAPSGVAAGATIYSLQARGYGATGYSASARATEVIESAESGVWTDTAQGTRFRWLVTPVGTTTQAEAMRLQDSGALTIGQTTDDGVNNLQVTGGTSTDTLAITGAVTGTFTANGATPVTVTNANVTANSVILITLKTVGGTVGAVPSIKTITPTTGFTVAATAADTSTYNYAIIS